MPLTRTILAMALIICVVSLTLIYAITSLLPLHSTVIAHLVCTRDCTVYLRDLGKRITQAILTDAAVIQDLAWSPDGTQLAYSRDGSICVFDLPADQTRCLTNDRRDTSPSWSPDGTQLVYARMENGVQDIAIIDASTADETVHSPTLSGGMQPSWSPDGETIALVSIPDSISQSSPVLTTTSLLRNELHAIIPPETDAERLLAAYWPRWSPDGQHIAYVATFADTPSTYRLCILSLSDNHAEILTDPSITLAQVYAPSWSPDGSRIAMTIAETDGFGTVLRFRIAIVDIQTGELTYVTPPSASEFSPAWRP